MSKPTLRRAVADRRSGFAWALFLAATPSAALAQDQTPIFSATGTLEAQPADSPRREADRQEHTIRLLAGQRVLVEADSAEFDTLVQLRRQGSDELLVENDDFGDGLNSRMSYSTREGGDYVVTVTSFAPNESGSYQVTVRPAPSLPPAETQATYSDMRSWLLFRGELTSEDVALTGGSFDDYEVAMAREFPVIILLDAEDDAFDPIVQVLSSEQRDGQPLASNDDGGGGGGLNSVLLFDPPENGNYVIRVTSFDGQGRGTYQLRVGEALPIEE